MSSMAVAARHRSRTRVPDLRPPARRPLRGRRQLARAGHRGGAAGRPAVRGGGGVPRHAPRRAARRQRPCPQPAHRRTRGAGLVHPPAGSRGRPGPAGRPVTDAGRAKLRRHRGAPHRHPAGATCRTGARKTPKRRRESSHKLAESLKDSARAKTAGPITTTNRLGVHHGKPRCRRRTVTSPTPTRPAPPAAR